MLHYFTSHSLHVKNPGSVSSFNGGQKCGQSYDACMHNHASWIDCKGVEKVLIQSVSHPACPHTLVCLVPGKILYLTRKKILYLTRKQKSLISSNTEKLFLIELCNSSTTIMYMLAGLRIIVQDTDGQRRLWCGQCRFSLYFSLVFRCLFLRYCNLSKKK